MRTPFMIVFKFVIVLAIVSAVAADDATPRAEYGPCVCSSVTFVTPESIDADTWEGATTRAITIALADGTTVCYDAERLAVAAMWRGGFLDFTKTHHTSYKGQLPPRPAATPYYLELKQPGWKLTSGEAFAAPPALVGYHLQGEQVALVYQVGDRRVVESPWVVGSAVQRTVRIEPGNDAVSMLVGKLEGGATTLSENRAVIAAMGAQLAAMLDNLAGDATLSIGADAIYVDVPATDKPCEFSVRITAGEKADVRDSKEGGKQQPMLDFTKLDAGGPRRWTREITTTGALGEAVGAYAIDEIDVPEKPYGLWMRLSAIDFFEDGRCVVATLPGDVWVVSWDGDDIRKAAWQRYATGLYEPLGMKIVDGKIYVRGRDRITRLHDLNDDGEADFYEQFHATGPVGPGYHAFVTDLVTDDEGNFYYAVGGRKSPSIGEVIKVSSDGKSHEVIAEHFRCPNGMGFGGPHGWLTIADNPDGKFPTGGVVVQKDAHYGEEGGPRTAPFFYLLPPKVDTSSGSQCWADAKRFGPLSGALLHTSYSTSSLSYVLPHASKPHPSGFAVQLPFGLKSGPMRLAVSPRDGQMYIAGQRGWDSNAAVDGALSRMRYTGEDACLVTGARATPAGVELRFSAPVDAATIDYDNFSAARISDTVNEEVEIIDVESVDERTVLVRFESADIDPAKNIDEQQTKRDQQGRTHYKAVPPLAITMHIKSKSGAAVKETVYCTINGR